MFHTIGLHLQSNPIAVKAIIAGTMHLSAEGLNQYRNVEYKPRRAVVYTALGLTTSPLVHFWYQYLSTSLTTPKRCIAADQLLFAPFMLFVYIASMKSLECQNWSTIKCHIIENYKTLLISNWIFWIPINFINFRYVPLYYRTVYGNAFGLLWSIYLTHKIE